MAKASERAKAETEAPKPIDLSAEFQTADQVAAGSSVEIDLPSGAKFPCRVARATGPHFARVVLSVKRRFTKGGRVSEDKLTDAQVVEMSREIIAKANFLDIGGPVLVRQEGKPDRIVQPGCKWEERAFLLSVYPDLQEAVARQVSLDGKTFAETVAEVGEG